MNGLLQKILNSKKIHLTFSEKNFVKESYEVLSIFEPNIDKIFYEKFVTAVNNSNDKFTAKKVFLDYIYTLRYPVSYHKIKNLSKYKLGLTTELDETKLTLPEQEIKNIKIILNQI